MVKTQDAPLSLSPNPVLDDPLPIGTPLPSDSLLTGADHTSSPESHSSMLSAATPFAFPPRRSASGPDLTASAEDTGSAKVVPRRLIRSWATSSLPEHIAGICPHARAPARQTGQING
jgi:hypothetical protein